jgi:hypothetical protein
VWVSHEIRARVSSLSLGYHDDGVIVFNDQSRVCRYLISHLQFIAIVIAIDINQRWVCYLRTYGVKSNTDSKYIFFQSNDVIYI